VPFVLPAMCGGMYLKVEGRYTRLQRGDFGPLVALVPKGQHDTVNFEFIIQSGVSIIQYYNIKFSYMYEYINLTLSD